MNSSPEPIQEHEWGLQDYINLFLRQKMVILSAAILVFTTALVITFIRPAKYYSAATLVIESPNMGLGSLLSEQTGRGAQDLGRPLEFYVALVESKTYQDMLYEAVRRDSFILNKRIPAEELFRLGAKNLKLTTSKTEMVKLGVTAPDPQLAYHYATIATEVFKQRCRQIELEEARNVVDYVEKQKDISRDKLENAERSLQEFNETSSFAVSDQEGGLIKKLMELENQLAQVQAERELAEANLAAYTQRLSDMKAPAAPGLNEVDTPQTKSLRGELDRLVEQRSQLATDGKEGATINALDQQIDEVRGRLYTAILQTSPQKDSGSMLNQTLWEEIRENRIKEELQLYMLRNRERFFQRQVETYRRENPKLIEQAIEMTRLQRSKKVYEDMFNILLEKGEEARIKSATGTGGIRIIDFPTVPNRPVPVNIPRNLLLGLILGFGLGIGLALVREYLDNTIRSHEELFRQTGLVTMGLIPQMNTTGGAGKKQKSLYGLFGSEQNKQSGPSRDGYTGHLISQMKPREHVVDAYRTLRTNLQFASVDKPIKVLLVTSALPGEGKTLSSANIAISHAQLGKRVLLIDGDMRKPRQHELFGIKSTPGLSNYMAKNLDLEQVIYQTSAPNLYLMPCGTIPPNPAEMIASQRMTDMIDLAQLQYDLIVIDAPPIRPVTDPLLFAAKATHILLVVKSNSTQMREVQESIALLHRTQTPILGVLFNYVKTSRGYGDYYRYNYYYSDYSDSRKAKSY